VKAFIGLGSNLGDREKNIRDALGMLASANGIEIIKVSSLYETKPYGITDQPDFLNAVVEIGTFLDSFSLLELCLETENSLGRVRIEKWGPRSVDIDILFYGDSVIHTERLDIPHPLLHEREFVLFPLEEIAPDYVHPVLKKTVNEMKSSLPGNSIISVIKG